MTEIKPVAYLYRWKIDGEFVKWRLSDASQKHPHLKDLEEVPLYGTEAMAEIERLRAEIARKSAMPADHRYWEGRYRDEAAENERLRNALEPFALISAEGVIGHDRVFVRVTTCAEYYHAAAEALKEKTP